MDNTPDRIIRDAECQHITGLKNAQRYKMEAAGLFPLRRRITERLSGYSLHEVQAWVDDQLANAPKIEYVRDESGKVRRTA